jgi:hypothetical protein
MCHSPLKNGALLQPLLALMVTLAASRLMAGADSAGAPSAQPPAQTTGRPDTSGSGDYFVLESQHKVFTGFRQIDTVRMLEPFAIGEGEERGLVFLFNPHFSITDSGRVLQLSDTLYNPAVRVRVSVGDSVEQESWAFYYSSAPHFRRTDMFGFRLVDFRVSDRFVRVQGPQPAPAPPVVDSTKKSH